MNNDSKHLSTPPQMILQDQQVRKHSHCNSSLYFCILKRLQFAFHHYCFGVCVCVRVCVCVCFVCLECFVLTL
jgi:hypothetical protein